MSFFSRTKPKGIDPEREAEIREWILSLVGETFEEGSFAQGLKDGILLCRLMNAVKPGSVPSNMKPPGNNPFKRAENVTMFIRACRSYGVPEMDLFETVDLIEERGLYVVTTCILALRREYENRLSGGAGKKRTPTKRTDNVSLAPAAATSSPAPLPNTPTKSSDATTAPPVPPTDGSIEEVTDQLRATGLAQHACLDGPVNSTGQGPVGKRGGGFGLDAEIAMRQAAKYDVYAEEEAQVWMEEVIAEPFPGDFVSSLKDGVLLCKLINAIRPGTIKKINQNTKLAFKLMDNITNFIRGCRTLGVPEHDIFDTIDLYEEKDIGLVVQTIHALGRTIQVTVPEFQGPVLGPKMAEKNERTFTEEQLRKSRMEAQISGITAGSQGIMERSEVSKIGSVTFGAEMAGIGDTSVTTKFALGSAEYMEKGSIDTSRDITYGADKVGIGDTAVQTQWSKGSQGIMERSGVDASRSITYGADTVGIGDTNVQSQWSKGSQGIMERSAVDASQSITYGADTLGVGATNVMSKISQGSHGIMERSGIDKSRNITHGADQSR